MNYLCVTWSFSLQGAGEVIPGGATLIFDIELIAVEDGPAPVNVFKQIDLDADNNLSREELSKYLKDQVTVFFALFKDFGIPKHPP